MDQTTAIKIRNAVITNAAASKKHLRALRLYDGSRVPWDNVCAALLYNLKTNH